MANIETLLLGVTNDNDFNVGLPPRHAQDSFRRRAATLGKINNISQIACSPKGELFCICSGDLYKGPLPSQQDWFSVARRVGRFDWNRIKCLTFHPDGDLYCTTRDGDFYKGPPPDNEFKPWFYDQATKIGKRKWHEYESLLFDPDGNMYGVANDKLYTGPPPTDENTTWKKTLIGASHWQRLTYFMAFTKDKKLWAIDKHNGNFYRGDVPSPENPSYLYSAQQVGWNYGIYKMLTFTEDRTIVNILSFEFLVDEGKVLSEEPQVLQKKDYNNTKSTSTMRHTFLVKKTVKETSSFSHDHGFTFSIGAETTVKTTVGFVVENKVKLSTNLSTSHSLKLTETNETETSFESSTNIEAEPGKAVRVVSSVMKAELNVPYKALARTLFGADVEVRGAWLGVSHYNLMVTQEDSDTPFIA